MSARLHVSWCKERNVQRAQLLAVSLANLGHGSRQIVVIVRRLIVSPGPTTTQRMMMLS